MAMRADASHAISEQVKRRVLAVAHYEFRRQILRCLLSAATVIRDEG